MIDRHRTVVAVVLFFAGAAVAQVEVGQVFPLKVDSSAFAPQPAAAGEKVTAWSYTLSHPGATYISLHFTGFDLPFGAELTITDPPAMQQYTLRGRGKMQARTFWARHIKGDSVVLRLTTVDGNAGRGFVVDEYAAGFIDPAGPIITAVCGEDDRANAVCYRDSHPVEYDRARTVTRLLVGGIRGCTGSLVSPFNDVLTNNHCITRPSDALNTDFDFMAETPECDTPNCTLCFPGDVYSGSTMLGTHMGYDYSLVRITDPDPVSRYGYLQIDNRPPVIGERIYNAQHADAFAKLMAIFSDHPSDVGGLARICSVTEPTCIGSSGIDEVGYYLDGRGGSSGSPIIAASSHALIALHHCTGCPNRGIAAWMFYPEIASFVTGVDPLGGIAPGSAAVSADSSTTGRGADLAIDTELSTGWCSGGGAGPHWLQLDLGRIAAVSGLVVWHASAGGADPDLNTRVFEVQSAATAAGPWSVEWLGDNSDQLGFTTAHFARPRPLRHLRLWFTDPGVDGSARVQEWEVFGGSDTFDSLPAGMNVAPQSISVQVSSQYSPDLGGDKAVDGTLSLSSRWVSSSKAPAHTLTLDLGSVRSLDGFVYRQASNVESSSFNANALSFQTARSPAGPWYTDSLILTDGRGLAETRTFASPKDARYVRLSIADPGADAIARVPEFEVITAQGVRAGFAATPPSGAAPLTADFTDLSTGGPTSWSWDFGDGFISTDQHPSHTYQSAGSYTVRLTSSGPNGSHTRTRLGAVQVQGATADFTGEPTSGRVPLTVQFTDHSGGVIDTWHWDFGDGNTGAEQNPVHTYTAAGRYTVTLSITGPGGATSRSRFEYIEVHTARADCDADGDVDQEDFGRFQVCLSGPGISQPDAACPCARLDTDDDVDSDDFAVFADCFGGPGMPVPGGCPE